jgi:hypothetical protein
MNLLIIYDGNENLGDQESEYSYSLGLGEVKNSRVLSTAEKLNDIALKLRDEYSDYIYTINDLYLENKLIFDNKLSLYFISDLSNKRSEIFDTYATLCHIVLLRDYIKENNISKVRFINCESRFVGSFKSTVDIAIEEVHSVIFKNVSRYFLSQAKFFFQYFFVLLYIKLIYSENTPKKAGSFFLSRYPLHFDKNFKEEKYGALVRKSDWLLLSILTDGMHQGLSLSGVLKAIKDLSKISKEKNVILLDKEVKFSDLIRHYLYSLRLFNSFRRLNKHKYIFKGIDISNYIIDELNQSILRIPRLTLYKNSLRAVFAKTKVNKFYYYLHEYSYGRFFTYILSQYYPSVKRIGFQHGPASMRKMLYFLSRNEVGYHSTDYKYYLPMPSMVLAEDEQSVSVYKAANYKYVHVMENIYRLTYLNDIKRNNVEKNSILVACGLHDGDYLFNFLKDEMTGRQDKKYYFKLHPRSNKEEVSLSIVNSGLTNVNLSDGHIKKYLDVVNEVIYTYSSAGMEAHKLGIKVRMISLPGKINQSPLLDKY